MLKFSLKTVFLCICTYAFSFPSDEEENSDRETPSAEDEGIVGDSNYATNESCSRCQPAQAIQQQVTPVVALSLTKILEVIFTYFFTKKVEKPGN